VHWQSNAICTISKFIERMKRLMLLLTGFLIIILSACSHYEIPAPECPDGETGMSFSGDIQPIFDQRCVACHAGTQSPDLTTGWSYDELIDGGYVDVDFPCESRLHQVIYVEGHYDNSTEEEKLKILGWIQEGAQDN